jgi:threonine dehydratase/cystathionine beta-lyase/cystathionine gamma-synthase
MKNEIHRNLEYLFHKIHDDYVTLKNYISKTPLVKLNWLGHKNRTVWAKLETNQSTNSFKIRGAYNALLKLDKNKKIFSASAGNHGLAISYASQALQRDCTIFIPSNASELKVRRLIQTGVKIETVGKNLFDACQIAKQQARIYNAEYISPYSHLDVICGQGSISLEVQEQSSIVFDHVLVPLGGGGLLTGIGAVFKNFSPSSNIIATYPQIFNRNFSDDFTKAMQKEVFPTIADGLAVQHDESDYEFSKILESLINSKIGISESEIENTVIATLHNEGILIEGAAATALAPLLYDPNATRIKGNILVIISGGNISSASLMKCFAADLNNSRMAAMLGHQSIKLSNEIEKNYTTIIKNNLESDFDLCLSKNYVLQKESKEIWSELLFSTIAKAKKLLEGLSRFREYVLLEGLSLNFKTYQYVFERVQSMIEDSLKVYNENLNAYEIRDYYRIFIQEFAFLKSSLSWCSASNAQSQFVMFFDSQENNFSSVNYDRYGSLNLKNFEVNLLSSLGFSPEENDLLLVSSGQAAYSVIESFLISNVLHNNSNVVTAPYIYFEAQEQLERLSFFNVTKSLSWDLDDIICKIEEKNADVIFIDPMANLAELNVIDFKYFSNKIKTKNWRNKWLIIDGTMISGGINIFHLFSEKNHPNILYYESGSKYLQFGLDLQMAGVIVCSKENSVKLNVHRRNIGAVMYQSSINKFPEYNREIYINRMYILMRNSLILVNEIEKNVYLSNRINVSYPKNWKELSWKHGGGVVALSMKKIGLNHRSCLDAFIEILLTHCKDKKIPLTKGVSFGFSVTRVSAAAAMAENAPPFLRFSVGEESVDLMHKLSSVVVLSLKDFFESFDRNSI